MVSVKIVKSNALGKTILPSYFPIGVIAKRFGYMEYVLEKVSTLHDIDYYLVKRDEKLVLMKLTNNDKKSYLSSFYMRKESEFDKVNEYTEGYEIFPADILLESEYLEYLSNEAEENGAQIIERTEIAEKDETIYSDSKATPIDLYIAKNSLDSQKEELVLKASINYYLIAIGLKPIDEASNQYPLHFLSTKGDALLKYALLDYFTNRKILDQLVTNESMKLALGRLGFYEFLEADTHLAGTFFEVLYACAMLQNKTDIRKKMEAILVGEEAFKTKLPTLKFKK